MQYYPRLAWAGPKLPSPAAPGPPQLHTSSRGGTPPPPPPFDSATPLTVVTVATVMLRGDDIWDPAVGGMCYVAVRVAGLFKP